MMLVPASHRKRGLFDAYLQSLSAPIDSYLEGQILASAVHRIVIGGRDAGSFAVEEGEGTSGGGLLTHFHLERAHRHRGGEALAAILEAAISAAHPVTTAIVPSCDEFMLFELLDRGLVPQRQAYYLGEGLPGPADQSGGGPTYRLATAGDIAAIEAVSGDFLDRLPERVAAGEIHVGHDATDGDGDSKPVAVGIAEPGRLLPGFASIGMFTAESRRRTGIGTATLRYLRDFCHAAGLTPIAGCSWRNKASRATLQAAGMVPTSMLLRFELATPEAGA